MSELNLQPTEEMIEAGVSSLWETLPGAMDALAQDLEPEELDALLSDTVTFLWQALIEAQSK